MSAAPVLSKVRKVSLEVASGPLKGEVFHFTKPLILIGRGLENDLVLETDTKISRMHIEIRQNNGLITIHNVTEKNTALINGQLIKTASIDVAIRLLIGDTELFVRPDVPSRPASQQRQLVGSNNVMTALKEAPVMASHNNPYSYQSTSVAGNSQAYKSPQIPNEKKSKLLFYAIIGVVILIGALLTSQQVSKSRKNLQIKTTEQVETEVKLATETAEEIEQKMKAQGVDSRSYQMAQQQYVRGFRDYNQGQYSRAIHELSAAVTYYPQHDLARRYYAMAKRKLDELVRMELDLGQRYRGQHSYRMCVASFKKVIILLDDLEDKTSKEAQQLMNECESQQKEHY